MVAPEFEQPLPSDAPSLDVPVTARELPKATRQKRLIAEREREAATALLQPRIDGHLKVFGIVLDALEAGHRQIADQTDLDLAGDTRQAAIWIVAGRCIGGTRAAVALLASGFGAESATQERAVHEATRLLGALADPEEIDIPKRWLADDDGDWVRPWQTRNAQDRFRARARAGLVAAMDSAKRDGDETRADQIAAALQLEGLQEDVDLLSPTRQIYDVLSRIGHSRRSGIGDAVSAELRQMATGPHPDPGIRAEYVEYGGLIVEEVTATVGDALGRFYGPGWYIEQIKPLLVSLGNLREAAPLTGLVGRVR